MIERFGERLRRLRQERKLLLRATAVAAGISGPQLHRIETGERSPPTDPVLQQLARLLGEDLEKLRAAAKIEREHTRKAEALSRKSGAASASSARNRAEETQRGSLHAESKEETLGERLRRRRLEKSLGLREVCALVDISSTYLSRVETMKEKVPPAEALIGRLATALDDDFDVLMHLAHRVPEDVALIITSDPVMPTFLRTARARNLSGDDLIKLLKQSPTKKR